MVAIFTSKQTEIRQVKVLLQFDFEQFEIPRFRESKKVYVLRVSSRWFDLDKVLDCVDFTFLTRVLREEPEVREVGLYLLALRGLSRPAALWHWEKMRSDVMLR